jgi:hypothetical protein
MNEEDRNTYLEDFKKGDIQQKIDMWFFAVEQVAIWEELIAQMSNIATMDQLKQGQVIKKEE